MYRQKQEHQENDMLLTLSKDPLNLFDDEGLVDKGLLGR